MMHLDDGRIQAFLDDELPHPERAAAASHLVACRHCRAVHEELARARSVFAATIHVLDAPARASRAGARPRRKRTGTLAPSLVRAAIFVLLMAAAASAAVPGSPVRQWIVGAPEPEAPSTAGTDEAAAPASPAVVGPVVVAGTVLGQEDRPLPFARIRVVGDTVAGWTDEAGRFRLEGGPGENWRVRVTHPGYRVAERTVALPGSGTVELDLRLEGVPGPAPDPLSSFEPFHGAHTLPALLNTEEVTVAIQRAYPAHLVEAGADGEAVLRLWLDEEGRVARSVLAASSGHPALDSLALRVSRAMRFRPARSQGAAVGVIVHIPVMFVADDRGGDAAIR